MLRRRPNGVIAVFSRLTKTQHEQLALGEITLVLLDPADAPARNIPSVGASNWNGGLAATPMLLKLVNGEQPRQSRVELATDLVVRESTAPPPPA
ncbi:hypothetical protein ACGFJC_52935 [Nonomuraea fuscirosea]|uniref:hypothetical protein n=1 Tax=Nonomuraea fuscirosea TaxID=1291556 RepID=UPI00341723DB